VGSRLQIHESKYESVARFRIHTPWKRSLRDKETNTRMGRLIISNID
jgi:hypothetical protein